MKSPDGSKKLEYYNLTEFAMSSPLMGECFLVNGAKKITIDEKCTGPPVWSSDSRYVAVPVWRFRLPKGNPQKVLVYDTELDISFISEERFNVLTLLEVDGQRVVGSNTPNDEIVEIELGELKNNSSQQGT
ncbi:hypothetical protein ACMA1I_23285 [Pontibacter sp. 13R65]|uniref:hypothetical protein n=1 Tax=Pontibacter sp. 13R65 TaxID=3127458 RepID=UPI00301BB5A7